MCDPGSGWWRLAVYAPSKIPSSRPPPPDDGLVWSGQVSPRKQQRALVRRTPAHLASVLAAIRLQNQQIAICVRARVRAGPRVAVGFAGTGQQGE